ncbi:MAG TPA: type II secretion system protein F, partial [Gammaproteobacteria bacterium]|nr:type II secretion system protein F [Gammaproteobacteria bacterium]
MQNAPSEAVIRALLRRQGINPTTIKKQNNRASSRRKQKIRPVDIAIFSRQLATMIGAGVPLVQALDIVARGNDNFAMRELILSIRASIEGGSSLSEALAAHPVQFDDLFVNLVGAGEKSGALETLLDKIATYKEKAEAIKAKVRKALTYPTVVTI